MLARTVFAKQICRNCHFLAKEHRSNNGEALTFALTSAERTKAERDATEIVVLNYSLKCHMGVWDEGVGSPIADRNEIVNLTPRKNDCFFFAHRPSMLFEAARELQKRADENRQLKKSNTYTRIGLYVASAAVLINAIVNWIKSV